MYVTIQLPYAGVRLSQKWGGGELLWGGGEPHHASRRSRSSHAATPAESRPLCSASFYVDILTADGLSFPTETTLNKKWLAKPLLAALVIPAVQAVHGTREGGFDLNTIAVTVDGVLADTSLPASAFVAAEGAVAQVVLRLPAGLSSGAHGKQSATFHMFIDETGLTTPTQTTLNKKWLAKPLRQALVEPSVRAYYTQQGLPPMTAQTLAEIRITVDGAAVDGSERASSFVKDGGTPIAVHLTLPSRSYTIRRITRV